MALHFAVGNALGQGHHGGTFAAPLTAAVSYGERKCTYGCTKERCAEARVAFDPIVFEIQGGIEPRASAILHRIAEGVAAAEDLDLVACKKALLDRLAPIFAR